jgi:nitroimidazol reductase NimA-like FMN-containing flavoprotein (pyridoxamine 5'-phosphate oxidase superfamily)
LQSVPGAAFRKTARTKLRRLPKRGHYQRDDVYSTLDEGLACHVGFALDGQPYVIPTTYGRSGDLLYIHGSAASRTLRELGDGIDVCVTVTIVDGLVLARSLFHHSFNYRSVVVFGRARLVTDPEEKLEALRHFVDHVAPGRWAEARAPTAKELKATTVLALPIEEASAKMRSGPPADDEEDYALPVWAGVIPLHLAAGAPLPDGDLQGDPRPPEAPVRYARPATPPS